MTSYRPSDQPYCPPHNHEGGVRFPMELVSRGSLLADDGRRHWRCPRCQRAATTPPLPDEPDAGDRLAADIPIQPSLL